MEINQIIVCKLCNNSYGIKALSRHLKLIHNIKYFDYVKENIQDFVAWKLCKICGNKTGNISKYDTCSKKCYSINMRNVMKLRGPIGPMSINTKKKLSKSIKNWYSNNEHPWQGKHHTKKTKEKISRIKKEYLKTHAHPSTGKHHSKETKKMLSEISTQQWKDGVRTGMTGKTHTPETIKKIFKHQKMNKLEKLAANILKKAGYKYTFQFFIVENDICKSYDFKIKGLPIIIETDGDYWHGNPETKYHHETAVDNSKNDIVKNKLAKKRGYTVLRFWESDIKKEPHIIIDKINEYLQVKK